MLLVENELCFPLSAQLAVVRGEARTDIVVLPTTETPRAEPLVVFHEVPAALTVVILPVDRLGVDGWRVWGPRRVGRVRRGGLSRDTVILPVIVFPIDIVCLVSYIFPCHEWRLEPRGASPDARCRGASRRTGGVGDLCSGTHKWNFRQLIP